MSDQPNPYQWVHDAIASARQSSLPILLMALFDEPAHIDDFIDAIEVSLLSIEGDITEDKIRNALSGIIAPLAVDANIELPAMIDAIVGTLEWAAPNPKFHTLNQWKP